MVIYKVRIKGIYSTALAVALKEKGYILTDLSEVLKKRLADITPSSSSPPDVTIKSLDDPNELLIISFPWEAGVEVDRAITEMFKGMISAVRGRLGLYTVVDGISKSPCKVLLPGGLEGNLISEPCPEEGRKIRVTVVREAVDPGQEPLLKIGARVVGKYSMVHYPASGVSFSEFVRDEAKALLLSSVSRVLNIKEFHVHFRSSSKDADINEVLNEVQKLANEAKKFYEEGPGPKAPSIVRRGEYISIMYLPRPAKEILDQIRSKIVKTIKNHHSLRASGKVESQMVDVAEEALKLGSCNENVGLALVNYIARSLNGRKVQIKHKRPDRSEITLGPFYVDNVTFIDDGVKMVLRRTFTSRGILDGLGVEKRPGDIAITTVDTREWSLIHEYLASDGKLIGVYVNINTPPEIGFNGIRYLDLYIDVVFRPGEEPQIIDEEELDKAKEENLIGEGLYRRAKEEARRTIGRLKAMYL